MSQESVLQPRDTMPNTVYTDSFTTTWLPRYLHRCLSSSINQVLCLEVFHNCRQLFREVAWTAPNTCTSYSHDVRKERGAPQYAACPRGDISPKAYHISQACSHSHPACRECNKRSIIMIINLHGNGSSNHEQFSYGNTRSTEEQPYQWRIVSHHR